MAKWWEYEGTGSGEIPFHSGMDKYEGREWKEWQQRWDIMPPSQQQIIRQRAALSGSTDDQFILALVADLHVGKTTFDTIQTSTNKSIDKKFDLYYADFGVVKHNLKYDKTYWTKERMKEAFIERWAMEDYNSAALQSVGDIVALKIEDDTKDKVAEGSIDDEGNRVEGWEFDPDTGATTETGEAGPPEWETDLDKLFDDMGLDKEQNRPLYDHLGQMLKDKEINMYEVQQQIRADPEYLEQELNRLRDEWLEKLPGFQQEELALIEKEGERARIETEEFFKEDIAPTIRREVGLMGGRGREFQAHALAGAAAELEETRQNYMSQLRLDVEFADVERRRMAEAGRFEDIKGVAAFGGEQGLKSYQNVLTQRMKTLETMNTLSMQRSQMLSVRASERYQREYTKEIKRLERIETDRQKRAQKKAGKMGMFANVFSGIVMAGIGAMTGGGALVPAMLMGGAAGYGTSQLGMGGFTPSESFYMGRATAPKAEETPKWKWF